MISENGSFYENLNNVISKADEKTKIILLSATPMFDKPEELALTINLLIRDKNKMPIGSEFNSTFLKSKQIENGNIEYEMINKDLAADNESYNKNKTNELHNLEIDYKASPTSEKQKNMNGGKISTNSEEKTVRSRILNIINKKSEIISPTSNSSGHKSSRNSKSESESIKSESTKTSEKSHHSVKSFDDKLKAILKKDLATDSEMETSLNYTPENNDKGYLDVFSNSNVVPKKANNESKDKNKFFGKFMTGF